MKKTKIICSIGPASSSVEVMSKMVEAGMNVARINFSHATMEERKTVLDSVKEVRKITKKNVGVLYDTKGPEFRSGMLEKGEITLVAGNKVRLVKENILGTEEAFSVNHPKALDSLKVGTIVLLENGLMTLEVESTEEDGVTCIIISGGVLGNKKSMSVPGVKLDIPFISEVDREDLLFAATHEGDYLALSFVSTRQDVLDVKALFKENNCEGIKLIAKIESQTGMDNLDEILEECDGFMVARGDLGVEIPMYELPFAQKTMIQKCREQGKIAIVATEMLESMKKNIRPTRAEIADITQAVLDGTDAVMLSGETTTGKYPVETVTHMANVCAHAEGKYDYSVREKDLTKNVLTSALATSIVESANILDSKVIVSSSKAGTFAKMISNLKPVCPVLTIVDSEEAKSKLALNYGIYPVVAEDYKSVDELIADSKKKAKKFVNLEEKNTIIITGSVDNKDETINTDFMKIEVM